jgi:hypothetical protein
MWTETKIIGRNHHTEGYKNYLGKEMPSKSFLQILFNYFNLLPPPPKKMSAWGYFNIFAAICS